MSSVYSAVQFEGLFPHLMVGRIQRGQNMRGILLVLLLAFAGLLSRGSAKNITEILTNGYDSSIRPDTGGATKVAVTMHILSLPLVDSAKQTITLDIYFRQAWTDPRLRNDAFEETVLGREYWDKIWVPDTFFVNEISASQHEVTTPNKVIRVNRDGNVLMSVRYTMTFICPMDFGNFPFDEQTCGIAIESYAYTGSQLKYAWKDNKTSSLTVSKLSHLEFQLVGTLLKTNDISLASGNYSLLYLDILLRRSAGRYYNEFFYPCLIFSFVAVISMMVVEPIIAVGFQVLAIGFTVLLTAHVSATYPTVSYATALDVYGSMTNTFILLSFIMSLVAYLLKGSDLGPEVHELSNFSHGRVRLGNDEQVNLCSEPSQSRPQQTKVQVILKYVGTLLAKLFPIFKLVLFLAWALTNFFYLTTRPYTSSTPDVDLINSDWNIHVQ